MTERSERHLQEPPITPQVLLKDNQSVTAQNGIEEWINARESRQLLLASGCSDARVNIPLFLGTSQVIDKKSIAGSGQQDGFKFLLTHPGNNAILTWQHFNKFEVGDDGIFRGCGGLGAKRDSVKSGGIGPDEEGVHAYIRDDVHGTHVISQGYRVAIEKSLILERAGIYDKPVIAVAIDHSSGLVIPFALIRNGGKRIDTSFNLAHLFDEMDCPHLYENGEIPELDPELLPTHIRELLQKNQDFVKNTGSRLEFSDNQTVHNPNAIFITTSIVPVSVRYPETLGQPNTAFTIGLPYKKLEDESPQLAVHDLKTAMRQAHYAIMKANDAEKEGDQFFNTDVLVIETKNMEMSAAVVNYLDQNAPWMRDWLGKEKKVFIAATDEGQTADIRDFTSELVL